MSNSIKPKGAKPAAPPPPADVPQTPEAVALSLTWEIMAQEYDAEGPPAKAREDYRGYLLDLYAECAEAARGDRTLRHSDAA